MHDTSAATDTRGERRIHISLDVRDLARSLAFYEILLGTGPSKQRPDYGKFEPADLALNLALNHVPAPGHGGDGEQARETRVSHFGIQVPDSEAVRQAAQRLARAGLVTREEDQVTCCYAVQDKVWVQDPDGNAWELFVVTQADTEVHSIPASTPSSEPVAERSFGCCTPRAVRPEPRGAGCC
jgi:catechol 2,3-dioxygenase-like lactoylglutathione lyase family enzyme